MTSDVPIPEVELDAKDARIAELEAECERLRAVLQQIVDMDWDSESRDIAEAALAAPPDPKEK